MSPRPSGRGGASSSAGSGDDVVAEGGEGVSGGVRGEGEEFGAGVLGHAVEVGAGAVHGGVGAQESEGLGVEGVVGEVGGEEFAQARVVRAGADAAEDVVHREGADALAEVGAGVLPDSSVSESMSRMSSESWKAMPIFSQAEVTVSTVEAGAPESRAPN